MRAIAESEGATLSVLASRWLAAIVFAVVCTAAIVCTVALLPIWWPVWRAARVRSSRLSGRRK